MVPRAGPPSALSHIPPGKGIVEPEFVSEHLNSLHVLDGSWCTRRDASSAHAVADLPKFQRNAKEEFTQIRIPGAQFFDIDAIADKQTTLPHMLPTCVNLHEPPSHCHLRSLRYFACVSSELSQCGRLREGDEQHGHRNW